MSYKVMNNSDIEHIVVHCSATPASMDIGRDVIDRWHRAKGWWMIGYHFVIRRNGLVEIGRPLNQCGAHVKDHNWGSWGVCMVGGLDKDHNPEDNFTSHQYDSLKGLIMYLKSLAPNAKVLGHRDFSPDKNGDGVITPDEFMKDCPCFDVQDWYGANFQPTS